MKGWFAMLERVAARLEPAYACMAGSARREGAERRRQLAWCNRRLTAAQLRGAR